MEAFRMTAEDVAAKLGTDFKRGLEEGGVERNRIKYGANSLTKEKSKSLLVKVAEGATEPMMVILLVALLITIVVNMIKAFRGEPFDYVECVGIVVAISLSVTITIVMEGRSAKAFDALNKLGGNINAKVLRGGVLVKIPQSELVVGDIISLEQGDKIPVDARIISSFSLKVDESALTGESEPTKKNADVILTQKKVALAERQNMVFAGCFVSEGAANAITVAVGDSSEIGNIAKELHAVEGDLTPLQRKLNSLSKIVAVFGGTAASLVFIIQLVSLIVLGQVNFNSVQEIFITSIVLIVASVPEGLPTIVAVSLALNVIKMAKQNALVKKMIACETVGSVSLICSDKTGTLTENKMTVEHVCSVKGDIEPRRIKDPFILNNFCLNTTANITLSNDGTPPLFIGNPTECAMLVAYQRANPSVSYEVERQRHKLVHRYPFSSETKRMTSVVLEKSKQIVYVKGAPECVLNMCVLDAEARQRLLDRISAFQGQAKRIIALAHGTTNITDFDTMRSSVENGLIFDGFVVISDPIRRDVYSAVRACTEAGIKVKILTGDNVVTATAIAKELKLIESDDEVFHADDIDALDDVQLKNTLFKIKVVARSTPLTKLRIVKMLKELGEVVAVTGDGINDAPAIKHADVGIAMGIAGTEVSKEASDIVLLDDSFSTIVNAVHWGRGIYENFRRFIMFQLTVNLAAVLVTVVCILLGMEAPFNALELLWINIIMDGPPALTLGLEPIYDNLMKRKPVKRDESIITKSMFLRIIVNGSFIAGMMILQALNNFLNVWVEKEKTVLFTLFVVFQLFNAFNARELKNESVFKSLSRNKPMLVVMVITFVLQILITQFGSRFFNTVPLGFYDWLKVLMLSFSVVLFNEMYKLPFRLIENRVVVNQPMSKKSCWRSAS